MTTAGTNRQTTQNSVFAATRHGEQRQAYGQLAAQAPGHRITLPVGEPAPAGDANTTRVRQALADPRLVKRRPIGSTPYSGLPPDLASVRKTMLHRDPPEHTRLRKLVSAAFSQRRISALAPRIEQITDELLDKLAGQRLVAWSRPAVTDALVPGAEAAPAPISRVASSSAQLIRWFG
jgi:cytochrome P450